MQPGSLVVCVNAHGLPARWKPLVQGKIYTIRDIFETNGVAVLLEEVHNTIHQDGEDGYIIERFRELDTPVSICLDEILELEMI